MTPDARLQADFAIARDIYQRAQKTEAEAEVYLARLLANWQRKHGDTRIIARRMAVVCADALRNLIADREAAGDAYADAKMRLLADSGMCRFGIAAAQNEVRA